MKRQILFIFLLFCVRHAHAQQPVQNLVIITLDGMRWQEVFGGMDSLIAINPAFNQDDSAAIFQRYWAADAKARRSRLMPFLWTTVLEEGRLYGNRKYGNQVDNANPYWFSYPGYSEIFCGYVDTAVNSNEYPPNPNTNLLEYLNQQPEFKGKIAAFGAWDAFDRILNEQRAGFPVVCGHEDCGGKNPTEREKMINLLRKDAYKPFGMAEPIDVFTHYAALEYLKNKHPRVLYISYGETDEWAHHSHYRDYLDAARQTDAWIAEIWNWLQSDPQYRDKTALFITTDHGRGDIVKSEWTSHGSNIRDASQIWCALIAPGVYAGGEMNNKGQFYQRQFAQTLAGLLGRQFKCEHPVAEPIDLR